MPTKTATGLALLSCASRLHRLQIETLSQLTQPLTVRQFRILQRIDEGVTSLSDLSKLARRSLPTISESVEGMIRRGFVDREASELDRRAVVVTLTPTGRQALAEALAAYDVLAASIAATVPADERKQFIRFSEMLYDYAAEQMWSEDA